MSEHIKIAGWDIGGAHLKVVLLENGNVLNALQLPCELWRGLDKLETSIIKALRTLNVEKTAYQHVITMTGELVDLFPNRQKGVVEISNLVSDILDKKALFYVASEDFVTSEDVLTHASAVASVNWHASASLLAKYVSDALFVDIGSTTTDIIPIVGNKIANIGLSDAHRMREDTLVYTGMVRTPVMALGQKIFFEGSETNTAAEYFATMADVYRLTGDLLENADLAQTADGQGKTILDSARRLARMVGYDIQEDSLGNNSLETWQQLAFTCKSMQLNQIKLAVLKHLKSNMSIIGAGAGSSLVKALAGDLNMPYISIADIIGIEPNEQLSTCFPAYAVARLHYDTQT